MSQDISAFVPASCELLGLGEPTHQEPAFARLRNELFPRLVEHGFRSFAMETDRVAALAVNDFVREGAGTLDSVMREGFSHDFGELDGNRRLVAWMREYNENRPVEERLSFHGFDAPMETMSAPSPRCYLEHARDHLKLDLDFAGLFGEDERWSRTEAVMDPAMSVGATAEAGKLRVIADDMLITLYARAPEMARDEWIKVKTHLSAGLDLLRYHKQCARRLDRAERYPLLAATRDALMAQNLLDIRSIEAGRGPTLVFSHNLHLKRSLGTWLSAGAIVDSLLGKRYSVIVGSLGSSGTIELPEPEAGTYESLLQSRFPTWGLTTEVASGRKRAAIDPMKGYFPIDQALLDGADAVLHINTA
ncbi:erythromycin esterase family protein [Allokutzneria sp. A3M-2-11 16]|uniref:erythromycin esterase family protein n=1 Tax=Allokutzneria sp. A3M-2-11 16 TaxID=2962043 RepID=UPI0020B8D41B|nr:erythromycin esterase family protein [Allokutzneria sp. A3M-2-11 16]MCP3803786.1 erythromycin esterase family protein [Allokutzneria sp. A3M-2-11 16]